MSGSYVLNKTASGQYLFILKADNGETILTSEQYTQRHSAFAGIDSVRLNSPHQHLYERRRAVYESYYFVLKSENGQIIGRSEMYSSSAGVKTGIRSCKNNGPNGDLIDQT